MAWISSLVTPFLSAPLRCSSHSCMRPRQASMPRFSIERVLLERRSSVHAMPQQYSLRISWNGALNASAEASDALTYASPSTALRMARPLSRNALSIGSSPRSRCLLGNLCQRLARCSSALAYQRWPISAGLSALAMARAARRGWVGGLGGCTLGLGPGMGRIVDDEETRPIDLGVDLGGDKAGVAQELLDLPQVRA